MGAKCFLTGRLGPANLHPIAVEDYHLFAAQDFKKGYVADFLEHTYLVDKAGARAPLFGWSRLVESIFDRVGPWGAVRKGQG